MTLINLVYKHFFGTSLFKIINTFRNFSKSSEKIINDNLFKIPNIILKLIKSINQGFSIQILATTLNLLFLGVILIFNYYTGDDSVPQFHTTKLFFVILYIHSVTFQVSCVGDLTCREIKSVHAILRKIYSSNSDKKNEICLDVNLEIVKYNCGLLNFDWSLMKMVCIIMWKKLQFFRHFFNWIYID